MSRLDELIKEFCPDGVEYCKIDDVVDINIPPIKIKNKDIPSIPIIKFILKKLNQEISCKP